MFFLVYSAEAGQRTTSPFSGPHPSPVYYGPWVGLDHVSDNVVNDESLPPPLQVRFDVSDSSCIWPWHATVCARRQCVKGEPVTEHGDGGGWWYVVV